MSREYSTKKLAYSEQLTNLLTEYTGILIVHADNVGSNQFQQVRQAVRGKAEVLMGKNTQIRRVIRLVAKEYPDLEKLLAHVQGNVGLIFTNEDIKEIRDIVVANKVPAAARIGTFAPSDVYVPPGPTGLDPGQTSFFQALGIATKIARGSIEILNTVHLIKKGDKVGSSEVALLSKLNIKPFTFGLVPVQVYDTGATYSPEVLDMTEADMLAKFFKGVNYVACLSLALGYPSAPAVKHCLANAFQKCISIALATEYTFEQAQKYKDFLANPDAFKAAAPAAETSAAAEAAPVEESESDSDGSMGGGLFGNDSDSD